MSEIVNIQQHGNELRISARIPGLSYLNNVMRCNCFPELWDLYQHAHSPAKEFTESYAALSKFRRYHRGDTNYTVLHIGDGAHARTGAMFAFMTKNYNVSIDPNINFNLLEKWRTTYSVLRLDYEKARAESFIPIYAYTGTPIFVTFVHAHVDTDQILNLLGNRWEGAYVLACCKPSTQLSSKYRAIESGQDWNVLSPQRQYQVLVNEAA